MERSDEVAIAFFGTWMVTGLYLDGWSHIHHRPETFFTPWHGILYSGFGVAVAYFVARGAVLRKPVEIDRSVRIGFVLFACAAVGDLIWHTIFGIEVSLAALLSPTHLALMTGGLLMLSGPIRSARTRDTASFSTTVCFTLIAAVLMFFLQYAQALTLVGLFGQRDEGFQVLVVLAVLVTNAVLLGIAFYMRRNWRTPRGSFTFMFTAVAFAGAGLQGFVARHVITALVGGITADYLAKKSDRAFGIGVPLVMWSTWVAVMAIFAEVTWNPNIWLGAIFLACLTGFGLSVLVREPVVTRKLLSVRDQP